MRARAWPTANGAMRSTCVGSPRRGPQPSRPALRPPRGAAGPRPAGAASPTSSTRTTATRSCRLPSPRLPLQRAVRLRRTRPVAGPPTPRAIAGSTSSSVSCCTRSSSGSLVPRAAAVLTVSAPIARHLERRYRLDPVHLVPNYPELAGPIEREGAACPGRRSVDRDGRPARPVPGRPHGRARAGAAGRRVGHGWIGPARPPR